LQRAGLERGHAREKGICLEITERWRKAPKPTIVNHVNATVEAKRPDAGPSHRPSFQLHQIGRG